MIETLTIWDIIADNGTDSISVVSSSDGFKAFLPSLNDGMIYCIPDLQFDVIFGYGDGFGSKFDSNGNLMFISISFIGIL